MTVFHDIDPMLAFIRVNQSLPAFGRGAWTRTGIGFEYRYMINPVGQARIGTVAEKSLAHWAVAAGTWGIQERLISLGHMEPIDISEAGIFGPKTEAAVKGFQGRNNDPESGTALTVDGIVGMSDARGLFGSMIDDTELKYKIPERFLLGETNHESRLDPGAIGYYIYYPDFRGVDRGLSQINSKTYADWFRSMSPAFAIDWSGARLRKAFDDFTKAYPSRAAATLWDAAICNHNSPAAAAQWAKNGIPPSDLAATYVSNTKAARY